MRSSRLRLAVAFFVVPTAAVAGCNAVWGIQDLTVDGDAAVATDGGPGAHLDATTDGTAPAPDAASGDSASAADGNVSTAGDGGDAGRSSDAAGPDADAGFSCAAWPGTTNDICDTYDDTPVGQQPISGKLVITGNGGDASVLGAPAAPDPPTPPNVLWTFGNNGTDIEQGAWEYDTSSAGSAGVAPKNVMVDVMFYLDQDLPTPNEYVVPVTVNFPGSGSYNPFNIELACDSNSVDLLYIPGQDAGGLNRIHFQTGAGLAAKEWHHAILQLALDQNTADPMVTATLTIDGETRITGQSIGGPSSNAYGEAQVQVGTTFASENTPMQAVYIDNVHIHFDTGS